jgi:uncharacterized damage-inducible protein DinB
MTENVLIRLFKYNNWANNHLINVCARLSDEQLDAQPQTAVYGSIRKTLLHLVGAQLNYLSLLTLPLEERADTPLTFARLQEAALTSGEGLLDLAEGERAPLSETQLRTRDGFYVEPWVVMLQAIQHAAEHREQICSLLSAQGITPPNLDGWAYGEVTQALTPIQP